MSSKYNGDGLALMGESHWLMRQASAANTMAEHFFKAGKRQLANDMRLYENALKDAAQRAAKLSEYIQDMPD